MQNKEEYFLGNVNRQEVLKEADRIGAKVADIINPNSSENTATVEDVAAFIHDTEAFEKYSEEVAIINMKSWVLAFQGDTSDGTFATNDYSSGVEQALARLSVETLNIVARNLFLLRMINVVEPPTSTAGKEIFSKESLLSLENLEQKVHLVLFGKRQNPAWKFTLYLNDELVKWVESLGDFSQIAKESYPVIDRDSLPDFSKEEAKKLLETDSDRMFNLLLNRAKEEFALLFLEWSEKGNIQECHCKFQQLKLKTEIGNDGAENIANLVMLLLWITERDHAIAYYLMHEWFFVLEYVGDRMREDGWGIVKVTDVLDEDFLEE